jgi:hypothetical protein
MAYYRLCNSVDKITSDLLASFGDLPPDEYLREGACFRYRAFDGAVVKGDTARWNGGRAFFQSEDINQYAGGMVRSFPPLAEPARRFAERLAADPAVRGVVGGEELEIGCHQIRVTAGDDFNGYPAPEGFHRDGFEWVAITAVAQDNVSGGGSLVALAEDAEQVILDRTMQPGETLLIDDQKVLHYVSPVTPKVPGDAYRDVIVVTFTVTTP